MSMMGMGMMTCIDGSETMTLNAMSIADRGRRCCGAAGAARRGARATGRGRAVGCVGSGGSGTTARRDIRDGVGNW